MRGLRLQHGFSRHSMVGVLLKFPGQCCCGTIPRQILHSHVKIRVIILSITDPMNLPARKEIVFLTMAAPW